MLSPIDAKGISKESTVGSFRIVSGQAYRGLTDGFLLLRILSVAISVFMFVLS